MDKDKSKAKNLTSLVATEPEGSVYIRTCAREVYAQSLIVHGRPYAVIEWQDGESIL